MKARLAALFLLALPALANAENLPTPASSTTTMSGSTGASTSAMETRRTNTDTSMTTAPRSRNQAAAEFKADLAYCRSLTAEERRGCERETHAARAEGLYR